MAWHQLRLEVKVSNEFVAPCIISLGDAAACQLLFDDLKMTVVDSRPWDLLGAMFNLRHILDFKGKLESSELKDGFLTVSFEARGTLSIGATFLKNESLSLQVVCSRMNENVLLPTESLTKKNKEMGLNRFQTDFTLSAIYDASQTMRIKEKFDDTILEPNSIIEVNTGLLYLDTPCILHIAVWLSAVECHRFSSTSKFVQRALRSNVPGMKVRLYSHQIDNLNWMISKERGDEGPTMLSIQVPPSLCSHDSPVFFDVMDSTLVSGNPGRRSLSRGGLLCDEPGLGKTITVLSLILKTIGCSSWNVPCSFADDKDNVLVLDSQWKTLGQENRKMLAEEIGNFLKSSFSNVLFPPYIISALFITVDLCRRPESSFLEYHAKCQNLLENIHLWFPQQLNEIVSGHWNNARDLLMGCYKEKLEQITKRFENKSSRKCVSRTKEAKLLRQVYVPSSATLVVVPKNLLHHWKSQYLNHVDPRFVSQVYFESSDEILPEDLANCFIIFISLERLSREDPESSNLRNIAWYRIVVDEGHSLKLGSLSNYQSFLRNLKSKYRWIMTGTPAKNTTLHAGLQSLVGLLEFISPNIHKLFSKYVVKLLLSREPIGFLRITCLLGEFMCRTSKKDIKGLPPLELVKKPIRSSFMEINSYNAVLGFAKTNIVMSKIGNKQAGWATSLLNTSNYKHALEVVKNLTLSCAGWGRMTVTISMANRLETQQLLSDSHAATASQLRKSDAFMLDITSRVLVTCEKCESRFPFLCITPCVHTVCIDCFEMVCFENRCPVCEVPFDPDEFAALQPGFELKWMQDSVIETVPSKAAHIIESLKQLRKDQTKLKAIVFSQHRKVLNLLGTEIIKAFGPLAVSEFWGTHRHRELKKFTNGVSQIWTCNSCGSSHDAGFKTCDVQFLKFIDFEIKAEKVQGWHPGRLYEVGQSVYCFEAFHQVASVRKCGGRRGQVQRIEQVDCFVLLLTNDGSTGLDLSMVSHTFLADKIWDLSVQDQIIARAWRMGAMAPKIVVEQLYSTGTIEETMYEYDDINEEDANVSKMRFCLNSMKLLRVDPERKKKKRRVCFADQILQPLLDI